MAATLLSVLWIPAAVTIHYLTTIMYRRLEEPALLDIDMETVLCEASDDEF